MTLVNFTKKHRRRNGGIRLLGLIDQREVVSATYSELDKGFTELTLDEGASLSKFEFLEDGAEYRETIAAKDGSRDRGDHRSIAQRPDRRRRHDQRRRLAARLLAGIRQGAPAADRIGSGHHRPSAVGNHERDGHAPERRRLEGPTAAGRPEQPVLENLTVFRPNATTGRRNRRGGLFRTVSSASRPDTEGGRLTARPPS